MYTKQQNGIVEQNGHSIIYFVCRRYEVKFQNGLDCGGAYVKLLSAEQNLDLVSHFIF